MPLLIGVPLICLYVLVFKIENGLAHGIAVTVYGLLSISDLFHHLWYIIGYIWLIFLAPYLNIVLIRLQKWEFRNLIIFSSVIFVGLSSLDDFVGSRFLYGYTFNSFGEQGTYNIVLFIILYMIGGYISKYAITCRYPLPKFMCIGVVLTVLTFWYSHLGGPASIIKLSLGIETKYEIKLYEAFLKYNNFFVLMMAYYLFMFFKQLNFKSPFINKIARGTYSGYIIHMIVLSMLYLVIHKIFNVETEYPFYSVKALSPSWHILIAVCTSLLSLTIGYLIDCLINHSHSRHAAR